MILVLPVFLHRLGPEEVVVIPSWRIGILLQKDWPPVVKTSGQLEKATRLELVSPVYETGLYPFELRPQAVSSPLTTKRQVRETGAKDHAPVLPVTTL